MICFVSYGQHFYTHRYLVDQIPGCKLAICNYNWLLRQQLLPKATYIFTDRERMSPWELRVASALYQHLKKSGSAYRVLNNPARMADRQALLRLLHVEGLNDFNAYLVTERRLPSRYPVFIRRSYDHGKPLTQLIDNQDSLQETIEQLKDMGESEEGLLITEYCAEPVIDGLYRKLSAYRIGDKEFFYNTVHEDRWLVKYGTKNSATDELYRDELEMITNNAYASELRTAFELAGIEYGRADFGLVNGRCQIYEINSNPHTKPPQEHPNPIRVQSQQLAWQKYQDAMRALDTTDPSGPFAEPFACDSYIADMKAWAAYGIPAIR